MRDDKDELIQAMEQELAEPVRDLRSALTNLSEEAAKRPFVTRGSAAGRVMGFSYAWAPALLALLLCIALPMLHHSQPRPQPQLDAGVGTIASVNTTASDSALMAEIDSDLSQDAPDSLTPLEVSSTKSTHGTK